MPDAQGAHFLGTDGKADLQIPITLTKFPLLPGQTAEQVFQSLVKAAQSRKDRLQSEAELTLNGISVRHHVERVMHSELSPGAEDDLAFHWLFVDSGRLFTVRASCPESKANAMKPKFEAVMNSLARK